MNWVCNTFGQDLDDISFAWRQSDTGYRIEEVHSYSAPNLFGTGYRSSSTIVEFNQDERELSVEYYILLDQFAKMNNINKDYGVIFYT